MPVTGSEPTVAVGPGLAAVRAPVPTIGGRRRDIRSRHALDSDRGVIVLCIGLGILSGIAAVALMAFLAGPN